MKVLLDTNLLTRLVNPANSEMHDLAENAIVALSQAGHIPCLLPQMIYEFWSVATRPTDANGLGMSHVEAREEVDAILQRFPLLQDERAVFHRWLDLVTENRVSGKTTHDARIVAAMLRHGLTHLVTFNTKHFARFREVAAISPQETIGGKIEQGSSE